MSVKFPSVLVVAKKAKKPIPEVTLLQISEQSGVEDPIKNYNMLLNAGMLERRVLPGGMTVVNPTAKSRGLV